jgi:hypothetical protein
MPFRRHRTTRSTKEVLINVAIVLCSAIVILTLVLAAFGLIGTF